jgi:hypothetical protein
VDLNVSFVLPRGRPNSSHDELDAWSRGRGWKWRAKSCPHRLLGDGIWCQVSDTRGIAGEQRGDRFKVLPVCLGGVRERLPDGSIRQERQKPTRVTHFGFIQAT